MSDGPPGPSVASVGKFRRLAILIATNFVDMVGFMLILPLLPYYALDLQASPEMIGAIIASYSVAQLLMAPVWGRVSDRFGRRPAILIGLSASAVAYVVFGLADTLWLLFASRLVQGAGGGTTAVAQAYVADTVEPRDRARALGWLSAATSAGVMVGPAIGSLAARWGQEAPGFIAAGLCLVNVGFAWRWLPESRPRGDDTAVAIRRPIWHAAWQVVRHPWGPVERLVWIYAVGMLAFTGMTSVFALFLDAEHGISEKTIGLFFVYQGALSFIMRSLLLGPVVDRIGERWAMRLGAATLAAGLCVYPLVPGIWGLLAVIPLVPIGTALLFPSTTSLMSRFSERGSVGLTMGTAQTFAGLSRVIAPLVATSAFQRISHGTPFFLASGCVALVSLLAFGIRRQSAAVEPVSDRATAG